MRVRVLGSSAGGGFPQWNCNCQNCRGLRSGDLRSSVRTQSSIALSGAANDRFVLLNASPDIGTQLRSWTSAQPCRGIRDTGIAAVVLVDSHLDHCVGLLSLRENGQLQIHCTGAVFEDLTTHLPILEVLKSYVTIDHHRIPVSPNENWVIGGVEDLVFRALPIRGKAPPYSPNRERPLWGDNIAVEVTDLKTDKKLFYAPGVEAFDAAFSETASTADCIIIDGTFWTDDEMMLHGISRKTAKAMGHLPLSGEGGMLEHLRQFPKARRILIHINNTNPILNLDSKERNLLENMGIEVAFDGMEVDL